MIKKLLTFRRNKRRWYIQIVHDKKPCQIITTMATNDHSLNEEN